MNLVRIPEHAIDQAAHMMEHMGVFDNNFILIKSNIATFKQAEMTPIVLMDPNSYMVFVTAAETFGKKLH